jgi:hypothetical protein
VTGPGPATKPSALPSAGAQNPAPPAAQVRLRVVSEPPGAAVSLDGSRLSGVTPLEILLDPKATHRALVSLDGYVAQDIKLEPGKLPSELRARLEPAVPPGAVTVASSYEIDVISRGVTLARGQVSPRVSLPSGRQVLTVTSASYFLRAELTVNVPPGGEVAVDAPALGKLNIKANPDNCRVLVDGVFLDYPPILDKAVAAGSHVVAFQWPDGGKAQETVEVSAGKAAFVMGRKE